MATRDEKLSKLKELIAGKQSAVQMDLGTLQGQITFKNGVDGKQGKDGLQGIQGNDGANGKDGKNGLNGIDGVDGLDGLKGDSGINGNGIENIDVIDDELVVRFSNGTVKNLGMIKGRTGSAGIGLSAYRQALRAGYEGTEAVFNEMLASLPTYTYSPNLPTSLDGKDGDIWVRYV